MNKPTPPKPWWAALGFGPRRATPDTDYGDMGTAFGLDASMPTLPMDDDSTPPGTAPAPRRGEGGPAR